MGMTNSKQTDLQSIYATMDHTVQFVRDNAMTHRDVGVSARGQKHPSTISLLILPLFNFDPPISCLDPELISHKYVALAYDDGSRLDDHRSERKGLSCL